MRTGLLAVGAAMAIVGAGVVAAVVMPFGTPTVSKSDHTWQSDITAGGEMRHAVTTAPAGSAAVRFVWNSSRATQVYWFAAGPCDPGPGWCLEGGPLVSWAANTTGNWSWSGPPPSAYCVLVEDTGSAPVNFTAQFVESYPDPSHGLPMVPFALIVGGGSLLVGIGGLAIYLGVFLPSGVYQTPAPVVRPPDEPPPAP